MILVIVGLILVRLCLSENNGGNSGGPADR